MTQTGGQPGQEQGRSAQAVRISGVPDRRARQGGVDDKGPCTLQAEGEGAGAQRRRQPGGLPEGWRSHLLTRRNRGHRVQEVIDELRRYVNGWLNYFGISETYSEIVKLAEWVRRRVRLYYWTARRAVSIRRMEASNASGNQWKQPRTRRRHLLSLGIPREEVHMATRSRKGYWRMAGNSIVQRALTNRWLHDAPSPSGLRRLETGRP